MLYYDKIYQILVLYIQGDALTKKDERGYLTCSWLLPLPGLFLFFFFFSHCIHGKWKFPGQGSNLHRSCNLHYSCGNEGSLTHCATRERPSGHLEGMLWALFSPKLLVIYPHRVPWPCIRPQLRIHGQVLKLGDKGTGLLLCGWAHVTR